METCLTREMDLMRRNGRTGFGSVLVEKLESGVKEVLRVRMMSFSIYYEKVRLRWVRFTFMKLL